MFLLAHRSGRNKRHIRTCNTAASNTDNTSPLTTQRSHRKSDNTTGFPGLVTFCLASLEKRRLLVDRRKTTSTKHCRRRSTGPVTIVQHLWKVYVASYFSSYPESHDFLLFKGPDLEPLRRDVPHFSLSTPHLFLPCPVNYRKTESSVASCLQSTFA